MEGKNEWIQMDRIPVLGKWLHWLFLVKCAMLVTMCLSAVAVLYPVIAWVNRILSVGFIVVLFQLAGSNDRYKKAAWLYAVRLAGGLIGAFLSVNLLTMAVSICGIVAEYQELHAHSELVWPLDGSLSQKWHSLFFWQLFVGALTGILPVAAVVIGVAGGAETATITLAVTIFTLVVSSVFALIYLKYLKKTEALFA